MLPYFEQPSLDLGPLTVHAFGALFALGVIVGIEVFDRRARKAGLDGDVARGLGLWLLVGGLVGAHLVDRLLYNFDETLADPLSLFLPWMGLSSFGGLFGGLLAAALFFRRHPQGRERTWRYLDALAYAVPFGWFLGRVGCFLAFDHVGTPTTFFLGQEYADGVVRHNLGFEEALYWLPIAAIMVFVGRRERSPGTLVGLLAVLYAPGRFLLDFLRVSDERHAGLLVSQYAAIALLLFGVWALWQARRAPPSTAASAKTPQPGSAHGRPVHA